MQQDLTKYKQLVWKLYVLSDIIDGIATDIEKDFNVKFEDKHKIKQIKKASEHFTKTVDKNCSDETKEKFGELSDKINELITPIINNEIN